MKLKIAQVIGLNTDQKAAQVTSSTREASSFFAVLELVCDDAFTRGRQALSELEDFYFEFEGSATEKLNATFAEAEAKFSSGDFSVKEGPPSGWDLVLATVSGKVLYLIGKGQVEVYLKREGKLSPLLSVGTPSQLISGFLQSGDRFLLCTNSLISFLGPELEKSLSLPIETFEEEVGSKIGGSDLEDQGLAALAVEVMEENLEISPVSSQGSDQTEDQEISENPPKKFFNLLQVFPAVFNLFKLLGSFFPKSGRGRLIIAVVLIVVIVLGAGYKYKLSRDEKMQAEFNQTLQEAKDAFEGAKGLASLNPNEAKIKLDLAKDKINKALALKSNNGEAQNFKKQIEEESSTILKQAEVADFPLFLDLDLVKKDFRANQMSLSGNKLLLLDTGIKTLVSIDLAKKSNQILAGSEKLGEALFASLNGGLVFGYSKDKGVLRLDTGSQKLITVSKIDKGWGEIADIYGFAGNIYLLDKSNNQIWKYLPASEGYSDKREYLTKGTTADFSTALRMQIESSVYILKSGGEILRFTKGDKDNFSYAGLPASPAGGPSNVKDPKSIFVSSETENLYVLDSGNSRILILTKTGSYKEQITGSKFATITDLVVDEIGKKIYLLEGSKIFQVDLK